MINTVILMGRLCSDVDLRTTESGLSVAQALIAVDRRYQKQGAEKQADFIPVVFWRNTAEFVAKYFFKGDMIALEGALQSRKYQDKNGNDRTAYEVVADRVSFCGGKTEQKTQAAPAVNVAPPEEPEQQRMDLHYDSADDDLPF